MTSFGVSPISAHLLISLRIPSTFFISDFLASFDSFSSTSEDLIVAVKSSKF